LPDYVQPLQPQPEIIRFYVVVQVGRRQHKTMTIQELRRTGVALSPVLS